MRKVVPFMVCIRTDGQMCKAIFDAERNDISVQGLNMLKTYWNMDGLIIHIIFVPFGGMNSRPFVEQGILMHNTNDRTFLGLDYSTNSANVNVSALMTDGYLFL
jgi:hypothetical protein